MTRVILPRDGEQHVPIHLWGRVVPSGALKQLRRIAAQPYVVEHVAAMPDLHVAEGVAVGTVFATVDAIVPAALGGDLGCGVSAVRLDTQASDLPAGTLEEVLEVLTRRIPVGDAIHRGTGVSVPDALMDEPLSTRALEHLRARLAPRHLGTLGGGNHFVELDRDGAGCLWLLVHSGSRGLGGGIAAHHLRAAEVASDGELPALRVETPAGRACLHDHAWALSFAHANREALEAVALEVLAELLGASPVPGSRVDVHHNFVGCEEHFGRRLLVHRKGAIAAPAGGLAIIPGSMGTASYVVEGLGAPLSFASASHGAGRVMTRREARERIRSERFERSMRRVVFDRRRGRTLVEEAPDAYRDIVEVLEDEGDLIRTLTRLEPVLVLKG